MEWMPIETYDALKVKPKYAVFLVAEMIPENKRSGIVLGETISIDRHFGRRTITHWIPLPPDTTKDKEKI